jgi:hypothetical protein
MKKIFLVLAVSLLPQLSTAVNEDNRIADSIAEEMWQGIINSKKLGQLFAELELSPDSDHSGRKNSISKDDSARSAEFIEELARDLIVAFQDRPDPEAAMRGFESFVKELYKIEGSIDPEILQRGVNLVLMYINL